MTPLYAKQAEQYRKEGFAVFEGVLEESVLSMLREQCSTAIAREDARLDELGVDTIGLTHRGKRYFANQCQRTQPVLRQLLLSPLVAELCRATLGFNAYFFLDQFVVKGPEQGMPFGWHQDSGHVVGNGGPPDHLPYMTCWFPLDDATAQSGTLRFIPFSANPGARGILPHRREPQTNDLIAVVDESKMVTVEASPGSIVTFSSRVLHSTGPNLTPRPRRVYVAQYTSEVMVNPGSRHLRNDAIPLLRNGEHATVPGDSKLLF
jgi:ectoine hydroxylase-related dioxygenase (phytanoyl-CoA dioxygenase family)